MAHDRSASERGARRWFAKDLDALDETQRSVLERAIDRTLISRDLSRAAPDTLTLGQRLADKVALFGGSWAFIGSFAAFLLLWTVANTWWLRTPFDIYPFIFLNLLLSMLAAIQAPVIMMSQNRQAVKDRLDAAHDYEVNLKAEMEIMALHDKLDELRAGQMTELLASQQQQITLLTELLSAARSTPRA